jgi:hypothetical protein
MSVKPIAEYDAKLLLSHWLDVSVLFLVERLARCCPGHADPHPVPGCGWDPARLQRSPAFGTTAKAGGSYVQPSVKVAQVCAISLMLLLSLLLLLLPLVLLHGTHCTIGRRCESPPPPAFISEF